MSAFEKPQEQSNDPNGREAAVPGNGGSRHCRMRRLRKSPATGWRRTGDAGARCTSVPDRRRQEAWLGRRDDRGQGGNEPNLTALHGLVPIGARVLQPVRLPSVTLEQGSDPVRQHALRPCHATSRLHVPGWTTALPFPSCRDISMGLETVAFPKSPKT